MESGKIKKGKGPKFTQVGNHILNDPNLSWKAKGLMSYLLGLPDDWELFKTELVNRSKDGYDSMISGWKELEKSGYIETKKVKKGSLFMGYEYTINDLPVRDFPEPEIPEPENPQLIYTNSNTTFSSKTNNSLNLNEEFNNSSGYSSTSKAKEESAHHRIIKEFFEVMHPDFIFNPVHAKSVQLLIKNIQALFKKKSREITEVSVGDFGILLLKNLPPFFLDKDLAMINSKFNEIITEIQNKNNGITKNAKPVSKYAPQR